MESFVAPQIDKGYSAKPDKIIKYYQANPFIVRNKDQQ
jgi:hypothetical protein